MLSSIKEVLSRWARSIKKRIDSFRESDDENDDSSDDGSSGGGNGSGVISNLPSGITWLHANISNWKETVRLNSVHVDSSRIVLNYTKTTNWPTITVNVTVDGNAWIVAKVNGKWCAGTWEWLRPNQQVKNNVVRGDHVKRAPMSGNWKPQSGDIVYFMISSPARSHVRTVNERSNAVKVIWP